MSINNIKPFPIRRIMVQVEQDNNAGGAFYIYNPLFSYQNHPEIKTSESITLKNGRILVADYGVDGEMIGVEFL